MLGIKLQACSQFIFIALFIGSAMISYNSLAQENSTFTSSSSAIQYGYSIKATAELGHRPQERFMFRIGFSGGIGAYTGNNWFYPSLNVDLMLYHGGIGSSWPGFKCKNYFDVEAIISYTVTTGWNNRMRYESTLRPGIRNYPLYYFNNWNHPSLQNPYNYSASFGGNYIWFITRQPKRTNQFVGFLNLHGDRYQISYTNDGPPFFPPFGDQFDRYHTGGGFISFHGDNDWLINLIEVGFNKYTGYNRSSYELSNWIGNSYVFYKDTLQNYFNKSNWFLTVSNTTKHIGVNIESYNYVRQDFQHRIHTKNFYPFHLVPYEGFVAIGPVYYYQGGRIGLQ